MTVLLESVDKQDATSRPRSAVDLWLGQQLRQLRKAQGRSLAQVAQACGMSLGLLSQIERGLSSISVKALHRLALEFNVSTDSLVRNAQHDDGEMDGHVARAGTHRRVLMAEKGITKELFTPEAARHLDLCRAYIEPGGASGDELFSTQRGEHIGFVLAGALELWIENRVVLLNAGDSFCYASRTPRRWRNPGVSTTEVVWAISNIDSSEAKFPSPVPSHDKDIS